MLLSVDVKLRPTREKKTLSYFVSVIGKLPEIVIEVVSPKKRWENTRKKELYARVGIRYYVIWDPDEHLKIGPLNQFVLGTDSYEPYADSWFPELNLGLKVWHGVHADWEDDWLRWYGPNRKLIPTGSEQTAKARREKRKAVQAQKLANEARKQADDALARVKYLEEKLRNAGIKPNGKNGK